MGKFANRRKMRLIRHRRVREKVFGTPNRPRLSVFKSLRHIHVQLIDDVNGRTLVSASTLAKELRAQKLKPMELARILGKIVAENALKAGIEEVVFDRGGHKYHGVVKALSEASREAGLKF